MEWGNLRNWLSPSPRSRELSETREAWATTEALWRASPLAAGPLSQLVLPIVREADDRADRSPALPILMSLCDATESLLYAEDIIALEAEWEVIDGDMAVGVAIPFTPLGDYLGFTPLPPRYWPLLAVSLLGYVVLTQAVKMWLLRMKWI